MFRSAVISFVLLAAPAQAYDISARMQAAWTSFQTICPQALFQQQAFIQETPNPGPGGVAGVASSRDGQVVEARRFSATQMVTLRVAGLRTMRLSVCGVHDQGFDARELDVALSQTPGPWVAAFDAIVRPAVTEPLVGGQIPIGFVARGMLGEQIGQNDTLTHHYATTFSWEGEEILSRMTVGPYNIMFSAERFERAQ